jgi:hypothetical protein
MTDVEDRIEKLERELAELKAQQVKPPITKPTTKELLDAAARKPWPKYDPTEGFRLPASAAAKMAAIVPDVKGEGFNPQAWAQTKVAERGGFGPPETRTPTAGRDAWPKPIPISSPPGVAICDQMMDAQDAIDKAERMKSFGLAGLGGGPKITRRI